MSEVTRTRPIVVITGGSAGIGRASVREFAAAGYDVAVLARGRAGLDGAARSVEAVGGRCLPISVDVGMRRRWRRRPTVSRPSSGRSSCG